MSVIKIGPRSKHIHIRPFLWGIYFHLRWNLFFLHCKFGVWKQIGLRVDSRRQQIRKKNGEPLHKRYVDCIRFQISVWSTNKGKQQKPFVLGGMLYGGRNRGRR